MDWKFLFLSANGRIGQKDFWIGFLILFVAGFILGLIPVINLIAGLALIYPNVCLYSKRLHDFGKSGWLAAVPYGIGAICLVIMMLAGGAAIIGGGLGGDSSAAATGAVAAMGTIFLVGGLAFLVGVAFLLWVGLSKGDPGPNQYGPPPANTVNTAATFS